MKSYLNDQQISDYIGYWFDNNIQPENVFLEVDIDKESWIYEDDSTSGGVPQRVWHGQAVRFNMPSYLYTQEHAQEILKDLEDKIEELKSSYDFEREKFDEFQVDCFQNYLNQERFCSECEFERDRNERLEQEKQWNN